MAQRADADRPGPGRCGSRRPRPSGGVLYHRTIPAPTPATTPSCWPGWPKRSGRWLERASYEVREPPAAGALALAADAALTVVDAGYLRHQREWRAVSAARSECPFLQVETDVVSRWASSSRTNSPPPPFVPRSAGAGPLYRRHRRAPGRRPLRSSAFDIADPAVAASSRARTWTAHLSCRRPAGRAGLRARARLAAFIASRPRRVSRLRARPGTTLYGLRFPYLHPAPSPLEMALAAHKIRLGPAPRAPSKSLIVRRELAVQLRLVQPGLRRLPRPAVPRGPDSTATPRIRAWRATPRGAGARRHHDPVRTPPSSSWCIPRMHGYMRMYW